MLIDIVNQELEKTFKQLDLDISDAKASLSKRQDLCEYQCNSIFKIAKTKGQRPDEVGEMIVAKIKENSSDVFSLIEFVKPGFINLSVSSQTKTEQLQNLLNSDTLYESVDKKTYVLDYGGPNVAKPLHVGHLRSAVLGESLKQLFNYLGHKTYADVHLGDYGLQIGQVIYGLILEDLDDLSGETKFNIDDLERIYPKISGLCKEDEQALTKAREITAKLQEGDEKYNALFEEIVRISIIDIKKNYARLNVDFDLWYGESDSFKYMDQTLNLLNEHGLVTEDDGAQIVKFGDDKFPVMLVAKSDGSFLYSTSDLATIYQRNLDFDPDEYVYIVDARQALHFNQVFDTAKRGHIVSEHAKMFHAKFGTMNGSDNKPFKTRDGGTVKLGQLFTMVEEKLIAKLDGKTMDESDMQKIVNSVIKFADLQNFRETNYIFEIDRFTEFTGKTGPYILYSAIRIRKIIEDSQITEVSFANPVENENLANIQFKMLNFDLAINACLNDYSMHHLCEYVFDLASEINSLYQSLHIMSLEEDKKVYVVSNLRLAYKVLEDSLKILGIEIPSKM